MTTNFNNHATEVVLLKKNFKVIESVQREAQAMKVLVLVDFQKKAIIAEARANMFSQENIVGDLKAMINETVEIKNSFFPYCVIV